MQVDKDLTGRTVTLVGHSAKICISFEGHASALRYFTEMLLGPPPPPPSPQALVPTSTTVAATSECGGGGGVGQRLEVVVDGDDGDDGPIAHPVREGRGVREEGVWDRNGHDEGVWERRGGCVREIGRRVMKACGKGEEGVCEREEGVWSCGKEEEGVCERGRGVREEGVGKERKGCERGKVLTCSHPSSKLFSCLSHKSHHIRSALVVLLFVRHNLAYPLSL